MVYVEKLAKLSRIKLSDDEKSRFNEEISSILEYVGQIQNAASDIEREVGDVRNVMRKDEDPIESGKYTEDILSEAPQKKDSYVEVKKIL